MKTVKVISGKGLISYSNFVKCLKVFNIEHMITVLYPDEKIVMSDTRIYAHNKGLTRRYCVLFNRSGGVLISFPRNKKKRLSLVFQCFVSKVQLKSYIAKYKKLKAFI